MSDSAPLPATPAPRPEGLEVPEGPAPRPEGPATPVKLSDLRQYFPEPQSKGTGVSTLPRWAVHMVGIEKSKDAPTSSALGSGDSAIDLRQYFPEPQSKGTGVSTVPVLVTCPLPPPPPPSGWVFGWAYSATNSPVMVSRLCEVEMAVDEKQKLPEIK